MNLKVVTLWLGVFIDRMNLGEIGWRIMIGWTIWVVALPILLEIVTAVGNTKKAHSKISSIKRF